MSRLDRKRGRFSATHETNRIHDGLEGFQDVFGDFVDYYRFDENRSIMDDIYDEPDGIGRVFDGPFHVPAIHVFHHEGERLDETTGLYVNDELKVDFSFQQFKRLLGLPEIDLDHQSYTKDRMVYDNKVFKVTSIKVEGQIQQRDLIISMNATQMQPDELVFDAAFARWSA